MKTVLITGASSGYGRETALYFHSQGWNVIATMRTPRAGVLPESDRLHVVELDVTRTATPPPSAISSTDCSGAYTTADPRHPLRRSNRIPRTDKPRLEAAA